MTPLSGHTSPESAYVVADYPYGFRLRCQIRYWIETTRHGQRCVSQTTNPKLLPAIVWNKPKASTYAPVGVLFMDEKEHVQSAALSPYADAAEIEGFIDTYRQCMGIDQLKTASYMLHLCKEYAARKQAAANDEVRP